MCQFQLHIMKKKTSKKKNKIHGRLLLIKNKTEQQLSSAAEHQEDWVTRFLNRDTQICSQSPSSSFCFFKKNTHTVSPSQNWRYSGPCTDYPRPASICLEPQQKSLHIDTTKREEIKKLLTNPPNML